MRLTVCGATGGTGREVVRQAIAAGHEVMAVVRDPSRLASSGATVVTADVFDPVALEPAIKGSDAVISALGPRRGAPPTVCSAGIVSIITAMRATDVTRLVAVSAAPVAEHDPGDRLLYRLLVRPVIRRILAAGFADMAVMERAVIDSGLNWTIARPPRLTNRPHTGTFRVGHGKNVPGGVTIGRADLADALLRSLTDDGASRSTLGVAY
ncbi:MAG TPA: SDR family oxidoreductase [Pseudonocardiaceae bacterium]|jgi:putative NADH-flavin reductase|nr:SDR family oxidoreductase [Pseudonocardiaceae bacterium]